MADPKYAGLPGIVVDQPDVYETNDLPECEQEYQDTESGDSNPAFEVIHISGSEAHAKFKGKNINASEVDFSDRISRKNRTGYFSNRPIEWNIGGDETETVVQKYQRLQVEVNHLQQEIQEIQGTVKHGGGEVSVKDLSANVDELHSTLVNLNLEESLGKDVLSSISEPEAALQKKLINLLESFKKTGLVSEKKGNVITPPNASGTGISYELFYAPEHAKFNQMSRGAQLEKKLERLEALVGNNPEKMSSLSAWTNHKSLLGAVQFLSSRLALLEPNHLDHIEGRLHSIHTRMNSITEKKSAIEDADRQSKINELYDMVKKSQAMCTALPEIVDRLASVESLHQEAAQFSRSIKQLDVAQTQISNTLDTNASLLKSSQDTFMKNLSNIQNNMKSLDERVQKLPKPKTK